MRKHLFFSLFAIAFLVGCQTTPTGSATSISSADISGPAASAIAGDMAARFAEHAGPPGSSFKMEKESSEFSIALESALKGWGYTVVHANPSKLEAKGNKPTELSYFIGSEGGQVLARLSTDKLALGRVYSLSNGSAAPVSPLSVMAFE
ncbi:conjugal transfer protein TrbH [Rhizobium sp. AAP43]|uniref:conjugal transfer protein TrbH n=1 Tax=Rhizobium sp. AAP43 TaxID=1523420 RepID=UPI0006B9DE52|nr:conjugal transfer protein TrbH [Rhizobium sp. AAP43]KPF41399.1 conjugal transfer protein TrbH [Rhizobium sp. AAP43]